MPGSTITFVKQKEKNGRILYSVQGIQEPKAVYLYYLTLSEGQPLDETITLAHSLKRASGGVNAGVSCYIFSKISNLSEVMDPMTLWEQLGAVNTGVTLGWIMDLSSTSENRVTSLQVPTAKNAESGVLIGDITAFNLQFFNISMNASDTFELKIDSNSLMAGIYKKNSGSSIFLMGGNTNLPLADSNEAVISISFDIFAPLPTTCAYPDTKVALGGALNFKGKQWHLNKLYPLMNGTDDAVWGGGLRYYYKEGAQDKSILYPFYGPVFSDNPSVADFDVQLDLVNIDNASRSYFMVTNGSKATSVFEAKEMGGFTPFGNHIQISPVSHYGYYLNTTPDQGLYLAPIGLFELNFGSATMEKLMMGLSTLEYGTLKKGTQLKLIPNQNAYGASFDVEKTPESMILADYQLSSKTLSLENANEIDSLLTSNYRTSYVQILPTNGTQWSYFSQPINATYYAQTENGCEFPLAEAIQIEIGKLPTPVTTIPPAFPMVLYWSIASKKLNPNSGLDPRIINAYERQILATMRFNQFLPLAIEGFGPVYCLEGENPERVFSTNGFLNDLNTENKSSFRMLNAPPIGTANKLYFAKSGTDFLSINANDKGVVDPLLNTALMNSQSFIVLNDWGAKFPMDHELTIEGFTFKIDQITYDGNEIVPIMIFKYGQSESLLELIDNPSSWSNPDYFLADGDIGVVTKKLQEAIDNAKSTKGEPHDPFKYFRETILIDPLWTGLIVFNCPINGSNMPPDFQMLMAGLDGPLVAHHFGVELNQLSKTATTAKVEIEKSSLLGVIYYRQEKEQKTAQNLAPVLLNPSDIPVGSYAVALGDKAKEDYKFMVLELIVLFSNSSIQNFNCEVGLMVNKLFSRQVYLQGKSKQVPTFMDEPLSGEVNTFTIKGQYQKTGKGGNILFTSNDRYTYDFNPGEYYVRVLDEFIITKATLNPTGSKPESENRVSVNSRFVVNGDLLFSKTIVPNNDEIPDLFAYGQKTAEGVLEGLPITGMAFEIKVTLDANGQPEQSSRSTSINLSNLAAQENKASQREGSLIKAFPFKLSGILQADLTGKADSSLDLKALGKEVSVVQLAGNTVTSPNYAIKFELPMGSLGSLADAHASIDAYMLMSWGPSDATPDNDGASLFIQLPEASVGVLGFDLEGIVKTVFGDANLMKVPLEDDSFVYVLLFNNVAISILGIKMPPKVITDFIVFGDPLDGANGNMGWSIAATQAESGNVLRKDLVIDLIDEPLNYDN
tara:strand:+ start:11297 stop:15019 length:3723 start_codon:yes stop_codon:yes gene_type:complete